MSLIIIYEPHNMFKVKHGLDRIEKITTYFWLANIEQVYNSSRIIQVGIYKTILHSRYYKQETFKLVPIQLYIHIHIHIQIEMPQLSLRLYR